MATRPKFAKMANYSCECVKWESHFSRNYLANVGEFGEYLPSLLMNVGSSKIGCFMRNNIFYMYKTV